MRLRKIRLVGFKSFARKTELALDGGITAIVGPNGCGKSNVVDAVKWVLGEQRPSSLRAKEMMDVIFSGSGTRKAVGMAEVTLVFDNEDGALPFEHPEVALTRRLYRSGESGYLVNGRSCRLKDIREALMDTGSGPGALSIMEQGRIDAVLTANPVERRAVFEEAAGIGRYKARRKEAMRRLERIGEDLVRLSDVIGITEKQLRSLRYQASRARRYRELSDELRRKRTTWALVRYHQLLADRKELTAHLTVLEESERETNEALQDLVRRLSDEESECERAAARQGEAEAALLSLDAEVRSARERSGHGKRMVSELSDRIDWYRSEMRLTGRRLEEMRAEREKLADEITALDAEASLREAELAHAEEAIREAREAEREKEGARARLRKERVGLLEQQSAHRNERVSLEAEERGRTHREERLRKRMETLDEERERLSAELGRDRELLAVRRSGEEELRRALAAAEGEARDLEVRLEDMARQAAASDRKLSAGRSRLDLLENLRARREGMDRAVKRLLDEAGREGNGLSGIHGVVADLVRVDAKDAEGVELALGACAQGVVTATLDDALRAIAWLKERKLGRVLFLPLSEVREPGPRYEGNGGVRPALKAVRAEARYRPLVHALLSDSVLVDTVERARAVARDGGRYLRIVTGGGEVLNRIGTITGGRGRSAAALLARNAEIERLTREVREEEERWEALREGVAGLRTALAACREDERALRGKVDAAARETGASEAAVARRGEEVRRREEEKGLLGAEMEEIAREREEARALRAELAAREIAARREGEGLKARAAALDEELSAIRGRVREAAEGKTEIQIALARARERVRAARERREDLDRSIEASMRDLGEMRQAERSCGERLEKIRLDVEVAEREAETGEGRRARLLSDAARLRKEHEKARERLLSRRGDAEGLRERHEEYREALEGFRLKENENRLKIEGLFERVRDEMDLDLADLYEGFEPGEIDWEELDREVQDLRARIERMGNVNLEALEQLEEVDRRVAFLREEETDLLKSRESLLDVVRKVNRESRERFEKTFSEVRGGFRDMFRRLFGGGMADVRLEEGKDILEAGVEIFARPPGRELRIINLLSGGEKTLTAVALLFAIFKARPSPFALLDEVDAALDETSIERFLGLLREFTKVSQFVIITHNKRTMAEADVLYGVSMPEAGVSRPVSIRFTNDARPDLRTPGPVTPDTADARDGRPAVSRSS